MSEKQKIYREFYLRNYKFQPQAALNCIFKYLRNSTYVIRIEHYLKFIVDLKTTQTCTGCSIYQTHFPLK